ncbi:type IV secretion protein Rhs [Mucilaginibacter sp. Bleaf8]|uniref:type VI secretion system Vgr family protein n=1 Tax=Mucilaginibacter sp. Bleaf8 TaxID=2834430 RepID=UPI001BCEB0EB|nr:phage baseplate assembly protein V [Mucilaginibacter sp. Bleaf8]MBS7566753.1 type IV secretion protein Rhs [Mucilaginibacter sp. Bleaf8]
MEEKIRVDINIEGTPIAHFSSFTLNQRFNEHHTFELRLNHDQIEGTNHITLERSKAFIGKNITVQFGTLLGKENQFTGKITRVEISQSHGFQGDILISGFSPSILLDRGPDLGSYLNKDLKTILQQATADAPQNDLNFQVKPAYTSPIDYIIQYRESDFEFINRLSAEYHEWFYYDGTRLNFGKPDKLEEVSLVYGRDLHSLQYGMQIAPLKYQKFAYHSPQDQLFSAQPAAAAASSPDLAHVVDASNQVFSKRYNGPLNVRINSQKEIDTFVNDEHSALVSELLSIMGNGDNPEVGLGKVVHISTSMRAENGFQVQDFGKFLVTSVYHQLDGVGHYQNTFEGVSADSEKISVKEAQKPFADMQLATVVDNDDPKGQGRIKVQFKWQCTSNDPTEWLRVVSPNAGHGDTGKNRGFLVVPEKGDQVIVGFEEGNVARPMVFGSVYHSNSVDSSSFVNSNIKGMTSRRGSALIFDDRGHHLTLGTNAANFVNIKNGPASLTAQAGSKIVIHTGDSTITLEKNGSISITGKNISINGSESIDIQSPKITMGNIAGQGATAEQQAGATQTIDIKGKAITIEGEDTLNEKSKALTANGTESHSISSGKSVKVSGGQLTDISATTVKINS